MKPLNRRLLVEKIEDEPSGNDKPTILLPEAAGGITTNFYGKYKVLDVSKDVSSHSVGRGNIIVVANNMVEEVFGFLLVQENYVLGKM